MGPPGRTFVIRKSRFHIPNDDDNKQQEDQSPTLSSVYPPKSPWTAIQGTPSSTGVVPTNDQPLKSSLKSATSSSIADDMAASSARHTRAQSMPSTPAYGPKNVHFKEKGDGLESVRPIRRTGKPVSVSKSTSDTEVETETSSFLFPLVSSKDFGSSSSSSLAEIAICSPVPVFDPSPYANVHLESVSPPARPPVLHGTILVRNIVTIIGALCRRGPPFHLSDGGPGRGGPLSAKSCGYSR